MKPPPFAYHDPTTIAEAVALLGRHDNAKVLAGGQSLMPMLNMRFVQPDHLIDLNRIEGIAALTIEGSELRAGAMVRHRDLEFSELVRTRCPLIAEAVGHVGHRQTRNRGTLGGSLCHMDPSAELVAVAATLDAVLEIEGPNGRRELPFAQFPQGYMSPGIDIDEILAGIRFPLWSDWHGWAFIEFARRHGDFALASASVLVETDDTGAIVRAAVVIGGVATTPFRVTEAERLLVGNKASPALLQEAAAPCRRVDAMDDTHAPASYRQHLAGVLAGRALAKACERAGTPRGAGSAAHGGGHG